MGEVTVGGGAPWRREVRHLRKLPGTSERRPNGDREGDAAFALAFASQQYSVYSEYTVSIQ